YKYDTDKTLTQLQLIGENNQYIGVINWFAVHPTSMNNTNKLVTSDNVGYASILLEKELNPEATIGKGKIVACFASSNLGDSSPNTNGPKCEYSGMPCDILTSSCPPSEGACFATGPGKNQFESCKIIATKLFEGAKRLIDKRAGREITGHVKYVHQFIDMSTAQVQFFNLTKNASETVSGCSPAMGYSFAAGTTDGPGVMDFTQGTTTDNPLWNAVRNFLAPPTEADIICQAPKPILLATGRVN
ncbi:neutral ceramidase, partial [Contarinia nasturtii]|uniref:neutral ceramidase n=1 Tax=Contarinia nasturtii TaxID=265458 RepID=UPI0012D45D91